MTNEGRIPAEDIPPEHLAAVLEGLAQARAGQYAPDAEVEAAFKRFEQPAGDKE